MSVLDRLTVAVTFDPAKGYVATISDVAAPVTALSLSFNAHIEHDCGVTLFQHACKMGLEGIVSKRLGSRYRSA